MKNVINSKLFSKTFVHTSVKHGQHVCFLQTSTRAFSSIKQWKPQWAIVCMTRKIKAHTTRILGLFIQMK